MKTVVQISKDEFLKDFWSKEKVEVEADALKEILQLNEKHEEENKSLKAEIERLKIQVSYYRDKFMALDAKQPFFIDLRG